MDEPIPTQPILLLADSQLLFWRAGSRSESSDDSRRGGAGPESSAAGAGFRDGDGDLFLDRVRKLLAPENPKAAYVGASNGDRPEFFDLFTGAMDSVGITDCRMIPSEPSADDLEYFDAADLVLLAGGDVELGWKTFEANGLKQKIVERYRGGAVLIGISAGAVQLGLFGFREATNGDGIDLFETFKLIPMVIDVHQEPEWDRLGRAMPAAGELVQGLGIPSGGGAFVHPDMTVEPVRRPLVELSLQGGEVRQSLIFPPDDEAPQGPSQQLEPV